MAGEPGATRRAAVLGSPVAHSLSPALHRAAYRELHLAGWRYDAIECDQQGLPALLGSLGPEWAGLSLTMPLKRAVLPLLDYTEPLAAEVGAANTVVFADGQRRGFNTDVGGIVTALSEAGVTPDGNVAVLGNGATACSALAALCQLGATDIAVAVRSPGRAEPLLAVAGRLGVRVRLIALGPDLASRRWRLLVSTIPAAAAEPTAAQLSAGELTAAAVLDVGYDPWPTALAAAAAKAGSSVISGYEMLVHQAAGQVELMTGLKAPVSVMHAAGLAELARRRGISDGAAALT
ncbi:MAG TPA: shikimate dehydrogenase [Streptosporangiaceae bacterium]|nr:shikimate dehydrogenase [Streptosporangiaceae bacterium]